jgi:hypothetical protein
MSARFLCEAEIDGRESELTEYKIGTAALGRPRIGIPEPYCPLTHHRGNPDNIQKMTQINTFHALQFAYFLGKLKSIRGATAPG